MAKKRKGEKLKPWCWYCDREFDDDKILIQHQRMKHFKCSICHRKLNSASGLVIHMAQLHKITMEKVPNALEGHDTPELEIFGMDGVPQDDLQRHLDGLPIVPYNKTKMILGDASILPLLAAQKVSVASQLAESKNLIVQGPASSILGVTSMAGTSVTSPPTSAATNSTTNVPSANVIVSPPTSATMPDPYQQYYQYNPYAYHPQYAAYYQQYYAQQYAAMAQNNAVTVQETPKEEEEIKSKVEEKVASENQQDNPLENLVEIIVPPVIDNTTNRVIPGIVFTVPSIDHSIEELRSRLKKYTK